MRVCVDLFSGKEGWSSEFHENEGWAVTTVDLDPDDRFDPDLQADVMEIEPDDLPDADVVLASPPCVDFSVACIGDKWDHDIARTPTRLPKLAQVADSVALVYRTLWLIHELDPDYWFLENPRGMLRKVIGEPTGTVNYCQYGMDWQKPTDLWGRHPPMEYRTCSPGDDCHQEAPRGFDSGVNASHIRDPAERAVVPQGLSRAVLEAIEAAYENPPAEQSTLAVAADGGFTPDAEARNAGGRGE